MIPNFDAAPTLSPFQEFESKASAETYEAIKRDSEDLRNVSWRDYRQFRRQIWIRWLKLEIKSMKRNAKQALAPGVALEEGDITAVRATPGVRRPTNDVAIPENDHGINIQTSD